VGRKTLFLNARRLDAEKVDDHRILISLDDYTSRLHAQQEVRASEIRFRRLFEATRDGILLVDPDTRKVCDANPSARTLLGLSEDQWIGKELGRVGLFRAEQAVGEFFQELHERGATRPSYVAIPTADNGIRAIEVIAILY